MLDEDQITKRAVQSFGQRAYKGESGYPDSPDLFGYGIFRQKSCSDGESEQEMRFGDKGAVSFVVYKDTNGILKTNIENVKTK